MTLLYILFYGRATRSGLQTWITAVLNSRGLFAAILWTSRFLQALPISPNIAVMNYYEMMLVEQSLFFSDNAK